MNETILTHEECGHISEELLHIINLADLVYDYCEYNYDCPKIPEVLLPMKIIRTKCVHILNIL